MGRKTEFFIYYGTCTDEGFSFKRGLLKDAEIKFCWDQKL